MALWLYGFMALWLYGFMETSERYFIVIQTKKNAIQKKIEFLLKIKRNTLWKKNSSSFYAFNSVILEYRYKGKLKLKYFFLIINIRGNIMKTKLNFIIMLAIILVGSIKLSAQLDPPPPLVNSIPGYNSNVYSQVSPNPSNGNFLINLNDNFNDEIITIRIHDLNGNLVKEFPNINTTNKSININMENYASGLYYYKITLKNKVIDFGKFVIK